VETEKMKNTKEAIKMNICTFSVTGTTFVHQKWYFCQDCDLVEHKGCCEACASTCHKGHKLVERNFSSFYCDCGAGEGAHACQCLDFEKAKEILKSDKSSSSSVGVIVRTLTKEQLKQFYNPTGENFSMDEEEEEEEELLKTPTNTTTSTTGSSVSGENRMVTNQQLMDALLQTSTPTTPSTTTNTTSTTTTNPITQEHLNSFFNQFNNQNNQNNQ
jgi:arsenate reductase-like glutaredoxin family protein